MPKHRQPLTRSIILMGVSGCGKSTIGKMLSTQTGARFFDGDDFHPTENIAKMSAGIPLNDEDRAGWLVALRDLLDEHQEPIIIACSALKQKYRDTLNQATQKPTYVYLEGDREILIQRLTERKGHFMSVNLLESQLSTLEPPDSNSIDFQTISIHLSPEQIVSQIIS
ncbi:gluconokinase [Luteolibacter pohnpeiensis]|uniref:Gluconokinase n=1 Tax=Luteolibacter pohnpeiensis TaxID=454153 RepID=A0A934S7G9_9BACT|nr:gluconokinase [Luteolibacter pohnpeiensis]MBK1882629.1 gluconokinase [Luteolibacter pohnpeiensis]